MATQKNIPISQLIEETTFSGNEKLPLAIGQSSNRSARLAVLKDYFRDSTLVVFDAISDATPQSVSDLPFTRQEGAVYEIIYLTSRKVFVESMYYSGQYSYTTNFLRWNDYMSSTLVDGVAVKTVRSDKAFLNLADKELYTYDYNHLHNIFDTVRINAMTEEELENLENPIEGAFYATYE